MVYLKKLLNSIKEILIYEVVMLMVVFILGVVILLFNQDINIKELTSLINQYFLYPIIIVTLIMSNYFYKKYKKIDHEYEKYNKKNTIFYIMLGVSVALIMNIIFLIVNNYIKIYEDISIKSLSIYIGILITGIIGPIIEEILFRGILFNKLKSFNSTNRSMIYSTIIFAITHDNVIQIMYAFILGIILVYFYNKYKNILVPIIIHISANIIIVLYQTTIFRIDPILILVIFLLSIVNLYISIKGLIIKK